MHVLVLFTRHDQHFDLSPLPYSGSILVTLVPGEGADSNLVTHTGRPPGRRASVSAESAFPLTKCLIRTVHLPLSVEPVCLDGVGEALICVDGFLCPKGSTVPRDGSTHGSTVLPRVPPSQDLKIKMCITC